VLWFALAFFALNAIVRIFGFARGSGFKVLGFNYLSDFVPPVESVCGPGKRHKLIGVVMLVFFFLTLPFLESRDFSITEAWSSQEKPRLDAAKNHQEEREFLAENGKRQEVQTTPSGLQYRVIKQGRGPLPTIYDKVRCNYRATLLNGTEFDSSTRHGGKPAEFAVNQEIPGWIEALQKMHVGDKWQLFVPSKLAYDMSPPRAPIEPGRMLVFEIELLEIVAK
jgi:FKBP-type peptidyl-prolyl cis-trans isomerase FklB